MQTPIPNLVLCDFPAEPNADGWSSYSPYVLEVDRALKLAGLPFERRRVDIMRVKELNPIGQLPVLLIGDEKVADSTRILRRIEALVPGSMTGGLDERGVAEVWLWEEFADTALYPYVLATRWADERGWPVPRDAFFGSLPPVVRHIVGPMVRRGIVKSLVSRDFLRAGLDQCYARMNDILDHLDARSPEAGYWLGPRCTAADLGLFAQLHSLRLPHTSWRADELARRSRMSRWLDRVDAATR